MIKTDARQVTVTVDGQPTSAPDGMTLTALLVRHGVWRLRRHAVSGVARGPLCGMGVCFECEVVVDGRSGVRSCLVRVRDGMRVSTDG